MEKSTARIWCETFANWPARFRRKGVVMTEAEAVPFVDFLMTPDVLVLERATPDNMGARRVAVPFGEIQSLKYTEPLKTEQFLAAGFRKGNEAAGQQAGKARPRQAAPAGQRPAAQQGGSAVRPAAGGGPARPQPGAAPAPPVSAPSASPAPQAPAQPG